MAQPAPRAEAPAITALLDYVASQNSTGLIVIRVDRVLVEKAWAPPASGAAFAHFVYGHTADGALLEDVASQQKSFVAVLLAVAIDKGLLDVARPVSAYLGAGWSKATPEQEAITRDWLTVPVGMRDTEWRERPAALASIGNATGLVTTPRDVAKFGAMVLRDGVAENGRRVVSEVQLKSLFVRSAINPAYGRLWWLNGGAYAIRALTGRTEGPLIPAAPADLVGAFGAFDRRLYVVPSLKLVVVRTGASVKDKDFDQQLWLRLDAVLGRLREDRP